MSEMFHEALNGNTRRWVKVCPKCKVSPPRFGQGLCRLCHNAYMRGWRVNHRLSPEARRRASARRTAGMYVERGLLDSKPCEFCAKLPAEMHHENHSKPLEIRWLCKRHHGMVTTGKLCLIPVEHEKPRYKRVSSYKPRSPYRGT